MTVPSPPHLTVIIPAYNEESRVPATLRTILAYLDGLPQPSEVIVVDDGSRDRTAEVVREIAAHDSRVLLLSLPRNRGKGVAVRTGFVAARGDLVLFSDADASTPIDEYPRLLGAMDLAGASAAIGSRGLKDSDVRVKQGFLRRTMGQTFNLIMRAASGLPFRDTQCGFKLFRREAALPAFLDQRIEGFAFDVEILMLIRRAGLKIVEVPVLWINSPDSRVNIWIDPLRMLVELGRIRWNTLTGKYS